MKKQLLMAVLAAGLAATVYGQGIIIANWSNINLSTAATSNGLVWTNVNGHIGLWDGFGYDLGIEVYAGPTPTNLSLLAIIYPGDAQGTCWTGLDWGYFAQDPPFWYNTGVTPGAMAWVKLRMWWWEIGYYSTYADAVAHGVPACEILFQNPTGNPNSNPPIPPQSLTGMPAAILTSIACTSPPSITQQPASQTVTKGQTAMFTVSATSACPLSYQWLFNGTNIPGATNNTLVIANAQPTNAGVYCVVVYGGGSSTISSNATLTVLYAPVITVQPHGTVGYWGGTVQFSVEAQAVPTNISYLWYKDGFPIPWATNASLYLADLELADAGTYWVEVSNSQGTVRSDSALLVVNIAGVTLGFHPYLTINGVVGKTYGIQYTSNVSQTNLWINLTNLTLTQPVQEWIDTSVDASPGATPQRFYRVIPIP